MGFLFDSQGFQQVQNSEIFIARFPEESNYNASIVNILRIYWESIVNLSGMSQMPAAEELNL